MNGSPETFELLRAGKLEQVCPIDCREGWRRTAPGPEAAGRYCTACGTITGPEHWRRPEATGAQRDALTRARASRLAGSSRGRGQALVELALILPVLLVACLGAADAGRLVVQKADQDRRTAVVAEWAATHPGESWHSIAGFELPGCSVEAEDGPRDVVAIGSVCTFEPLFLHGLLDGLPIASSGSAAALTDRPGPDPSEEPSPSPSEPAP